MDKEFEIRLRDNFETALNNFDFATVHDVMEHLDWFWGGDNHAPSQKQMVEAIEDLFNTGIEYFEDDDLVCTTGGFQVEIFTTGKVEIRFVVRHSEALDEE